MKEREEPHLGLPGGPAEAQPTGLCQSPPTSRQEDSTRVAAAREHAPRHLLLPAAAPTRI